MRTPATQRVIVHGGQIVVNQRVRVNELDRARRRESELGRGGAGRDRSGRRERQDGPEPFASGEHAVAHRLAHDRGANRRRRQIPIQRGVDACARVLEKCDQRFGSHAHLRSESSLTIALGAGLSSPRSLRISMRRSASSSRA